MRSSPDPAGTVEPGERARFESALFARLLKRSPAALDELVDHYREVVYAVARNLCGPDLAEDVAQEVFLALWMAPERYDPTRGSLSGYLSMQARSRAVDQMRSAAARRARDRASLPAPPNASAADVETDVLRRMDRADIGRMVAALPEPLHQALTLAYFGGLTYRQVAAVLGLPEGTVKARMRAGLARLRSDFALS